MKYAEYNCDIILLIYRSPFIPRLSILTQMCESSRDAWRSHAFLTRYIFNGQSHNLDTSTVRHAITQ